MYGYSRPPPPTVVSPYLQTKMVRPETIRGEGSPLDGRLGLTHDHPLLNIST